MTGISCSNGILSQGKYKSIAPNSHIISLKILDKDGQGSSSHAVVALKWILDNAIKYNIRVVNLSIGSNDRKINYPLKECVEKLWKKGIVVVAAAPNPDGRETFLPCPPLSPMIITVGSWEDRKYFRPTKSFSLFTKEEDCSMPTLFAPGENIISLLSPNYRFSLPSRNHENIVHPHYIAMSGASMSTPFISSICALLLERFPFYHATDIKKILLTMADENHGLVNRTSCFAKEEWWN